MPSDDDILRIISAKQTNIDAQQVQILGRLDQLIQLLTPPSDTGDTGPSPFELMLMAIIAKLDAIAAHLNVTGAADASRTTGNGQAAPNYPRQTRQPPNDLPADEGPRPS